jgi:hypothetical protein
MEKTFHCPEEDGQTNGWIKKRAYNFISLLLGIEDVLAFLDI